MHLSARLQPAVDRALALTQVTLARLPQRQATALTQQVAQGKALPTEVVAQIVAKTDGVPLFVEELTKMVLESGLLQEQEDHYALTGPLPPLAIPVTLHDSLLARLDRLGAAKGLAQLGATLGREFAYALLQAVAPWDEETLQQGLQQLVEAELLYQRGLPPQATYLFKHALIQEAAYQSLLKRTRQQYHQQHCPGAGGTVSRRRSETQPELLAHHYTEAGLTEQAVAYWQRAGEHAPAALGPSWKRSATSRKGLELLDALPETPERAQQELDLADGPGAGVDGHQGSMRRRTWHRPMPGRATCVSRLGDTRSSSRRCGAATVSYRAGGVADSAELAEQLLQLAQRQARHPAPGGPSRSWEHPVPQWRLSSSPCAPGAGIAPEIPPAAQPCLRLSGNDVVMGCIAWAALTLWLLGYPDQAQQKVHAALTRASALAHPYNRAYGPDTGRPALHQLLS